jgi:hypothetical protein
MTEIYDFDNMRLDVHTVVALAPADNYSVTSLARYILERIDIAEAHAETGRSLSAETLVRSINADMVELRARVNSANG